MTTDQRIAELAHWRAVIADPLRLARLRIDILAQAVERAGREAEALRHTQEQLQARMQAESAKATAEAEKARAEAQAAQKDHEQRITEARQRIELLTAWLKAPPPTLLVRSKIALARVPYLRAAWRRLRGRPPLVKQRVGQK